MTFKELKQIIEDNNIPDDVKLIGDEDAIDEAYYKEETKTILLTRDVALITKGWKLIFKKK